MSDVARQQALAAYVSSVIRRRHLNRLWEEADRDARNKLADLNMAQQASNKALNELIAACESGK